MFKWRFASPSPSPSWEDANRKIILWGCSSPSNMSCHSFCTIFYSNARVLIKWHATNIFCWGKDPWWALNAFTMMSFSDQLITGMELNWFHKDYFSRTGHQHMSVQHNSTVFTNKLSLCTDYFFENWSHVANQEPYTKL